MDDRRLLRLARRQHGIVSRRQLGALGFSRRRVDHALETGWFVRVLPATYLVSPSPDTFEMRCSAANRWLGDVGFISGRSAGRLRGLAQMRKRPIEITVPPQCKRQAPVPWMSVRQTSWYDAVEDQHLHNGITLASSARMLFGLAADLRDRPFFDAADDAWNIGLIDPIEIDDYLDRHRCRGKNGVGLLERWLEKAHTMERPAQSMLERDLINALCDVGLPEPTRQYRLLLPDDDEFIHLDIAWPDIRLAIEPGHNRFHRGVDATDRDALRDLACAQLGWDVHRLTQHIRSDLTLFARRIRQVHHRRSADLGIALPISGRSAP